MAPEESLHQHGLREWFAPGQGTPTVDRSLLPSESPPGAVPAIADSFDSFFGADNDEDDAQSPTMPTSFGLGTGYELTLSERPFLATYELGQAGDPSPSPLSNPLDAWQLPMTSDIGVLQQGNQYYDSLFGHELFVTDPSTPSPGAPGVAAFDWPYQRADNPNTESLPPTALFEATPYLTTIHPVREPPPRAPIFISIPHETSASAPGDHPSAKKRARGRPRLYGPDTDSEDAGTTNHNNEWNTWSLMTATALRSRRLASATTGSEAAARRPSNMMAAKRYRDRVQSATDDLKAHYEALNERHETLQSYLEELRYEAYQLRCGLLERATCGCPLMQAYKAHVVRTSTVKAPDQAFVSRF
ncbi:hypothetical protein B0T14DRAFT_571976 [Immersiella caudata]|uniref:BZIP domain-containing protein n=1 Tax=Immersiella caudata TaxID=314043 RepID=A0AA39WAL2_9PEZI|nr:hypothetical protein B0T14DRAFT_571976 [Immersiella caudata]